MSELTRFFGKNKTWELAQEIALKLHSEGFEAYLAGGCVRDVFLKREANDIDIATNARPSVIEGLFDKTVPVGKEFGVMMVTSPLGSVEVATFRKEFDYRDGRHPERVVFCSAKEDAERRDFTVNAMFYDLKTGAVIDYFGGQRDIESKCLRCVGKAEERFKEDHLRMLRAVRFAAQLGFEIEGQTYQQICLQSHKITSVSSERVVGELDKVATSINPSLGIRLLHETGLMQHLWPAIDTNRVQSFCEVLSRSTAPLPRALFYAHWVQCLFAGDVKGLQQVHPQKKLNQQVAEIFKGYEIIQGKQRKAEQWMALDQSTGPWLLDFLMLTHPARQSEFDTLRKEYLSRVSDGISLPRPLVSGHDLVAQKIPPGPMMASKLHQLYCRQLEEGIEDKEALLKDLS